VPEVRIGGFKLQEKYKFVTAFLKAFESTLDPKQVVDELEERGFPYSSLAARAGVHCKDQSEQRAAAKCAAAAGAGD
jgi:hypothetical protein